MTALALFLLGAAALYGMVVAIFYAIQRSLVFHPSQDYRPPAAIGLADVREAPLDTPDGARVMIWRLDAAPGQPTLLYFHGNGDRLPSFDGLFRLWALNGWGAAVVSYRGYPGSTGSPSEAALVADGIAAFDALADDGVAPDSIVVGGFSLGTGVAVAVAAARPAARALYLCGAFAAIADIAKRRYPFLPIHTMMRDPFRSIDLIGRIAMPVFFIHGARDRVTPLADAARLHEAAPEPKSMLVLPEEGHAVPEATAFVAFRSFLADNAVADPTPPPR